MTYTFDQYKESADSIRRRIGAFCPKVAMILGSGLGFLGDVVEDPVCVSYRDIPHFKASNAAGCVNTAWQAGDLMLITDQIKIFMESPLRGENLPEFGVRFPDSSHLYTPALQDLARQSAGELGIDLKEGVYMYFPGPQYETPAEVRFARIAGADAVGMSTAPEVIVAGHCGMQVLGFTLCSNMAAGILDQPLSEQEVLDAAEACKEKFSRLVLACLKKLS